MMRLLRRAIGVPRSLVQKIREHYQRLVGRLRKAFESGRRSRGEKQLRRYIARGVAQHSGSKPVVHLYTVCRNEIHLAPWFYAHYRGFVDQFYIYDNDSDDGTKEYFEGLPKVEVRQLDTGGTFNSINLNQTRNSVWKESIGNADFVIVCDMDEFLYHDNIEQLIKFMYDKGYTILKPDGYNMVAEGLPSYRKGKQLTDYIYRGIADFRWYSKMVLFAPGRVTINYSMGAHSANPKGKVRVLPLASAKLLHYDKIDRELILRKARDRNRRRDPGVPKHYGKHYLRPESELIAKYESMLRVATRVI